MKLVIISDTHGMHEKIGSGKWGAPPPLPEGDLLIHCGDLSENQQEARNFLSWFEDLDYKYKIFIAGNHDRWVQNQMDQFLKYYHHYKTIKFLYDSYQEVEGLKIYGSPWTRNLPRWAFQVEDGEDARKCWNLIPNDTDVLVTHGPAYGIGDRLHEQFRRPGEDIHVGCVSLLEKVTEIKPILHVFGHIHEGRGTSNKIEGVTSINASMVDENYFFYPAPAFEFTI